MNFVDFYINRAGEYKKKPQHDDFSAPTSGAFDLEIGPCRGEFDQAFLKKSNARGFTRGGMIASGIDPDITRNENKTSLNTVSSDPHLQFVFVLFS